MVFPNKFSSTTSPFNNLCSGKGLGRSAFDRKSPSPCPSLKFEESVELDKFFETNLVQLHHHSTTYVPERGWVVLHLIGKVHPLFHHKSLKKVWNWINCFSFSLATCISEPREGGRFNDAFQRNASIV